jgi:hypothetical protein
MPMNLNKICPVCQSEYLPHIERCADCGAVLLLPEEHRKAQEEKRRLMEKAVENEVVVREGDLDWLGELHRVLIDAGIACTVRSEPGCNKSCCGDKCRLVVSPEDFERAHEKIEEYFVEMHPEARASRELSGEGRCPACGAAVGPDDRECRDCGLTLIVTEEEREESD